MSDDAHPQWTLLPEPAGGPSILGESPVWSARLACLFTVDIDGRRVHRWQTTSSGAVVCDSIQLHASCTPGAIGLVAGHAHFTWIATSEGLLILDWLSLQSAKVADCPMEPPTANGTGGVVVSHRFNDGKIGPDGALVVGSMVAQSDARLRKGAGKLWRIALPRPPQQPPARGEVRCLVEGATIPNGLDWDTRTVPPSLFFIDSPLKRVDCLEFSTDGASPPVRRSAFSTANLRTPSGDLIGGEPDGMARDREGMLWIAMAGGSHVCRLTPSGELIRSLRLPVSKVSSLCFGGPALRDLYVTSVSKGVDLAKEPLAGRVFVLENAGLGREAYKLQGDFHDLRFAFAERRFGVVTQHRFMQPTATSSPPPASALRAKL